MLLLGVAYRGTAFPLLWAVPGKKGNSDTEERLALLDTLLEHVEAGRIEAVVADREFIGETWFRGLKARGVVFVMRVRNNTLVGSKGVTRSALKRYGYLEPRATYVCPKRCRVFGLRLYLAVTKSPEGELVVLACNAAPERALGRYAQRWGTELLFSALKTCGFNLEATHLTDPKRLDRLLALLALAFTWAHLVGKWCHEQRPLNLKTHGYPPKVSSNAALTLRHPRRCQARPPQPHPMSATFVPVVRSRRFTRRCRAPGTRAKNATGMEKRTPTSV